ncbi:MAG: addiction module toxin RelE [Chitinophagales bacterium]
MKYNVIASENFKSEFKRLHKKYPSLKNDVNSLIIALETNPGLGSLLGKACYKIRLAIKSKGTGKSGDGRVISLVRIRKEEVTLLSIYDKSEKETISDQELIKLIFLVKD